MLIIINRIQLLYYSSFNCAHLLTSVSTWSMRGKSASGKGEGWYRFSILTYF